MVWGAEAEGHIQVAETMEILTDMPKYLMTLQDVVSEAPERFFIAEIVREKVFLLYQQEVPYSSTVSPVSHSLKKPIMKKVCQSWQCILRQGQGVI